MILLRSCLILSPLICANPPSLIAFEIEDESAEATSSQLGNALLSERNARRELISDVF